MVMRNLAGLSLHTRLRVSAPQVNRRVTTQQALHLGGATFLHLFPLFRCAPSGAPVLRHADLAMACVRLEVGSVFGGKRLAPAVMDPRQPGLPRYDPRMVGEEGMSRGQLTGQYGLLPGHSIPMQARQLQPENEYGIGVREVAMPPLGAPYLPSYSHLSTEQQLADLFSSQLELLGPPMTGPEDSAAQQDGEDKPRSKMQEKNRRVSC